MWIISHLLIYFAQVTNFKLLTYLLIYIECQFGCGISKMVGPKKQGFRSKFNMLKKNYRTRAIITRGLYTFYPPFEVHLCTVTFGLMYG